MMTISPGAIIAHWAPEGGSEMGKVEAKRDTAHQCWARVRLDSGEKVLISVAQSGVKILMLKWGGLVPGATLWASDNLVEVGEKFFDPVGPLERPLDSIIEKLIDCRSSAEVCARLSNSRSAPAPVAESTHAEPHASSMHPDVRTKILSDFGKHLQSDHAAGSICDVKRLPHPKETILRAVCEQILVEADEERLFVGLVASAQHLADYQEGVGEERLWPGGFDPSMLNSPNLEELDTFQQATRLAKAASDGNGERYEAFKLSVDRDLGRILSAVDAAKGQRDRRKRASDIGRALRSILHDTSPEGRS